MCIPHARTWDVPYNPGRLHVSVPSAAGCSGLALPGAPPAAPGLPVPVAVRGSGGFSPRGKCSLQRDQLGLAQPFPSLPQVGSLWLPGVCVKRLQQVKRFELDLLPCGGSVPAQPRMDRAAVLLLTNQEGRTRLIQSRSLPDEDLVAAGRVGSSVCGSC